MESDITQIIEEECEENLETEEIQDIEDGSHLNVIPFHLIKLARNDTDSAKVIEVEPTNSQNQNIIEPKVSFLEQSSKGKFSKYYKQNYRPEWELMPDFKGWLMGVQGQPTRAYCTYCEKTLHAHRLSLLKHTCTIRHQKAAQLHGNPTNKMMKDQFTAKTDGESIEHVISEEGLFVQEDNSNEPLQPTVVYTSQEVVMEEEDGQDEVVNDPEQEDSDEGEESASESIPRSNSKVNYVKVPPISTQVIDTIRGVPVAGLSVSLYKLVEGRWTFMNEGLTDSRGRCSGFFTNSYFASGRYKLHYDVDRYFEARKQESLFPFIETVFDATTMTRYHFPLMLNPNSYTTFRSTFDD